MAVAHLFFPLVFSIFLKTRQLVFPYGLAVRIPGFHPGGPGSTPGMGNASPFNDPHTPSAETSKLFFHCNLQSFPCCQSTKGQSQGCRQDRSSRVRTGNEILSGTQELTGQAEVHPATNGSCTRFGVRICALAHEFSHMNNIRITGTHRGS